MIRINQSVSIRVICGAKKKSILLLKHREALAEGMRIEQQHGNGSAADGRIGQIENGAEENEMLTAHKRHPQRPVELEQREVKHVDHPSVQPIGIALPHGHKRGNAHARTLAKNGTIEDTVDDITHRPCENQRDADNVARLETRLRQPPDVPQNDAREHQPHQRLHHFWHHLHAERHTVVLDKGDVEPVCDRDALPIIHVCLHHNLDDLVQNKREQNDAHRQPKFVVFLVHIVLITHE